MKTLYLECNMGAAGDMLMGALLELLPEKESFIEKMNHIGLSKVQIQAEPSVKCGIVGTHVSVKCSGVEEKSLDEKGKDTAETPHSHAQGHHHHHTHAGIEEIFHKVEHLEVEETVKQDIRNIYTLIAEAESRVHGKTVSEIHFHEVGTADALADITGCAILFHEIAAEQVIVSPVSTGFGQVRCAHGILPVPAPATALILQGIPCKAGNLEGELCTPTGAAILKYFASAYGRMPEMRMEKSDMAWGTKIFLRQTV